ncbi:SWIM zinc finger family protein [Prolixibacteraceae bacterium]|nr:SWIM zinc finger family protein [Prolixibacteraceae bacterium]
MTIDDFLEEITPYAIDRGLHYYERGAMENYERDSNNRWTAKIKALKETYTATLQMDDNNLITGYSCNCCDKDIACKHIAAIALMIHSENLLGENRRAMEIDMKDLISTN